jgi:hypothetical protein
VIIQTLILPKNCRIPPHSLLNQIEQEEKELFRASLEQQEQQEQDHEEGEQEEMCTRDKLLRIVW